MDGINPTTPLHLLPPIEDFFTPVRWSDYSLASSVPSPLLPSSPLPSISSLLSRNIRAYGGSSQTLKSLDVSTTVGSQIYQATSCSSPFLGNSPKRQRLKVKRKYRYYDRNEDTSPLRAAKKVRKKGDSVWECMPQKSPDRLMGSLSARLAPLQRGKSPRIKWTTELRQSFKAAFNRHGRHFKAIASEVGITYAQVRNYYYYNRRIHKDQNTNDR